MHVHLCTSVQVTVVKGDVYNPEEVSSAIQGCEGVLVALGKGADISATTLFSEGTRNIAAGMKEHGARRIVICNSALVFHERLEWIAQVQFVICERPINAMPVTLLQETFLALIYRVT